MLGCSTTAKTPFSHTSRNEGSQIAEAATTLPFARVALALRGCSSCSHCRSTIRQTTKAAAASGNVQVASDAVEIVFPNPTTLKLDEIVGRLASSGLHDLSVLDVLLDAEGVVGKSGEGDFFLKLRGTEQRFSLRVPEFSKAPPLGEPIRLRTVVQGWDKKSGPVSLELKYVFEEVEES